MTETKTKESKPFRAYNLLREVLAAWEGGHWSSENPEQQVRRLVKFPSPLTKLGTLLGIALGAVVAGPVGGIVGGVSFGATGLITDRFDARRIRKQFTT